MVAVGIPSMRGVLQMSQLAAASWSSSLLVVSVYADVTRSPQFSMFSLFVKEKVRSRSLVLHYVSSSGCAHCIAVYQ